MILTNDILIRIAVFILGLCGFFVAKHVYHHKKEQKPLVCPIRFDCNTVINSDYSKFFGIPLEILGMIYYGFIILSYLLLVIWGESLPLVLSVSLLAISGAAFLFSLYLIGVQIFALRKGCSWCFVSATISTVIFILASILY